MLVVYANSGSAIRKVHVRVILAHYVAQQPDFDSLFLIRLAEVLTLGLEGYPSASQRLGLVLKLGDGRAPSVGLLRSLDRLAPQVVKIGNELVIARDDLRRFAPKESIVDRELVIAPSSFDPVHPSIHAQLLAEHHCT